MKNLSITAKHWISLLAGAAICSFTLYVSLAVTLAVQSDDLPHFDHAVMAVFAGSVPVIVILVCGMDAVLQELFRKFSLPGLILDALSFTACMALIFLVLFLSYADLSDGKTLLGLAIALLAALAGGIARSSAMYLLSR